MSSHHFVKENQEPSVLFLSAIPLSNSAIHDLLEWSPVVMTWEGAVDTLLSLQVNIDQVYTKDIEKWNHLKLSQQPINIFKSNDSFSLLESILDKEINKKVRAINIISESHQVLSLIRKLNAEFSQISLTYFDENKKYHVTNGGIFEKWLNKDESLEVHELEKPILISTSGFEKTLKTKTLDNQLTLKTEKSGLVKIICENQNNFIVSELI